MLLLPRGIYILPRRWFQISFISTFNGKCTMTKPSNDLPKPTILTREFESYSSAYWHGTTPGLSLKGSKSALQLEIFMIGCAYSILTSMQILSILYLYCTMYFIQFGISSKLSRFPSPLAANHSIRRSIYKTTSRVIGIHFFSHLNLLDHFINSV